MCGRIDDHFGLVGTQTEAFRGADLEITEFHRHFFAGLRAVDSDERLDLSDQILLIEQPERAVQPEVIPGELPAGNRDFRPPVHDDFAVLARGEDQMNLNRSPF